MVAHSIYLIIESDNVELYEKGEEIRLSHK